MDTIAHIVFLNNQDSGSTAPPSSSTDYLLIEEEPINFVPAESGNTQYRNRLVVDPNGDLHAIDIAGNSVRFSGTSLLQYQNGLFKNGGVVEWGGTLTKTTAINMAGFNINFTGTGKVTIGGSNGAERLTVKQGNILLDDPGAEVILTSDDGTRWGTRATNPGVLVTSDGVKDIRHMAIMLEAAESVILGIPEASREPNQWYYCTDKDCFMYVRNDLTFQYINSTFTHIQSAPSAIWIVDHNLKRYPSAVPTDSMGNVIYGEIRYINNNRIQITFTTPISGLVQVN